jgi:hypothetical protein
MDIVAERHGSNWQRGWDRRRSHFFNHRFFVFDDGFWYGLDDGFYPYDYYGYADPYYYGSEDQGYYSDEGSAAAYSTSTVSAVQSRLATQGYYRGAIDGVYGPQTRRALTRYQSKRGLQVTGGLTPDTLQALGVS